MSKFYKKLVQPGRPADPALTGAAGFWNTREQRLARAGNLWPDGLIPAINYLVIGGGGGSGGTPDPGLSGSAGGGGAGGLVTGSFGPTYKQTNSIFGYTLTITIGAGGVGYGLNQTARGSSGGNTIITSTQYFSTTSNTITAYGGGGGGQGGGGSAYSGGSGGGAGGANPGTGAIGTGTQAGSIWGGYGNNGAQNQFYGGGGGGAGGPASGSAGGPGLYVNVANDSSFAEIFAVGSGSQQFGPVAASTTAGSGSRNGNGRNGVVILWWPSTYSSAANVTGSYTYATENGYKIYKFTGNGTITF